MKSIATRKHNTDVTKRKYDMYDIYNICDEISEFMRKEKNSYEIQISTFFSLNSLFSASFKSIILKQWIEVSKSTVILIYLTWHLMSILFEYLLIE